MKTNIYGNSSNCLTCDIRLRYRHRFLWYLEVGHLGCRMLHRHCARHDRFCRRHRHDVGLLDHDHFGLARIFLLEKRGHAAADVLSDSLPYLVNAAERVFDFLDALVHKAWGLLLLDDDVCAACDLVGGGLRLHHIHHVATVALAVRPVARLVPSPARTLLLNADDDRMNRVWLLNVHMRGCHVGMYVRVRHVRSYIGRRHVGRVHQHRRRRFCDCFRESDSDCVRDCDVLRLGDEHGMSVSVSVSVSMSVAPGPDDDGLHDGLMVLVGTRIMMVVAARASRDDDDVPVFLVLLLLLLFPLVPGLELPDEPRVSS